MSHGKPFSIFKRGRIYYAQFKTPTGQWSVAKSTGETSRGKAERWAIDYLTAGQIVKKENVTLKEYSKDFFTWDGSWATDKRVRGLRISPRQCRNLSYILDSLLLPYMGRMKLTDITRAVIKDYRNNLHNKGYSGNTINKALSALKAILETAEEEALIQFVPKIDRAAMNPHTKGILTIEEALQLFKVEWKSEGTHCHPAKNQYLGYVGNLLACSTGLRMGELQALVISDIHLDSGYIHVRRSWDKHYGMNPTTKTGKVRNIFIAHGVCDILHDLISINPNPGNPESFIFFSVNNPDRPVQPIIFSRSLYSAMRKIGITDDERRKRNITFHSWRHFFNSLLINAKVPLQKIQAMTGHSTTRMSQLYYHIDDMGDVVQAVENTIFSALPDKTGNNKH